MSRDVANHFANPASRGIWQHFDTSEPDLGSGTARCGGSSPSSCTQALARLRARTDSGLRSLFELSYGPRGYLRARAFVPEEDSGLFAPPRWDVRSIAPI